MILNKSFRYILNKTLKANQSNLANLIKYANKSFNINLFGFSLSGLIGYNGQIIEPLNNQYDVEIILPITLTTYLINQDKIDAFKKIIFKGDRDFGRNLLEILIELEFDYNTSAGSPITQFILTKMIELFTAFKNIVILSKTNFEYSFSEYLLYESEDLITQFENEQFCNEVDQLKAKVSLLEKRIDQFLKQKLIKTNCQ